MPIAAPIVAAGIGAASSLLGGIFNRKGTKDTNREERQWNERMFEKQNQRDIDFWKMQNAYNDPSAQMTRLGEAGLNPHLVYGNGATATAGPIATHSAPSYNPKAPTYNEMQNVGQHATSMLDQIYNIQQKKANIALTEAQTQATSATTANREFMNRMNTPELEQALKQTQAERHYQENSLRKGSLDSQSLDIQAKEATTRTAREMAGLFENGEKGANLFIEKYKQEIKNAVTLNDGQRYQNELKKLELDLNRKGIQKNDPLYMRIIGRILSDVIGVTTLNSY